MFVVVFALINNIRFNSMIFNINISIILKTIDIINNTSIINSSNIFDFFAVISIIHIVNIVNITSINIISIFCGIDIIRINDNKIIIIIVITINIVIIIIITIFSFITINNIIIPLYYY